MSNSNSKDDANCDRFHNRRKGFNKIKSMSFGYKPGLVPIHCVIRVFFNSNDPFTAYGMSMGR